MASIKIRISVDDGGLKEKLLGMSARARDYHIPLRASGERVKEFSRSNFFTEGGGVGGWAPLQPEYAAWKAVHYGPLPILVRTGALAESIVGARGVPVEVDSHKMDVRLPGIEYAKFHQYGTRQMAARPIVITPPGFARMASKDVADYLMGWFDR